MPAVWRQTIETHRAAVRDAILEATWELVTELGPLAVNMSQVAEATGIGRATLYKYFPDVESILHAWHERHVRRHLDDLARLASQRRDPGDRVETVLMAYARIARAREQHGSDLGAVLHGREHVQTARHELTQFLRNLLAEAVAAGHVRDDVPLEELASYCLHALDSAGAARSEAGVHRLVSLVLAALQPSPRVAGEEPPAHAARQPAREPRTRS